MSLEVNSSREPWTAWLAFDFRSVRPWAEDIMLAYWSINLVITTKFIICYVAIEANTHLKPNGRFHRFKQYSSLHDDTVNNLDVSAKKQNKLLNNVFGFNY